MWEKALIGPNDTIRQAMAVIDREAIRAAFVVDAERKLLGMVTDGDMRRGLLKGLGLEVPITEVMNANPITCTRQEASTDRVRALMESRGFLQLPVVDGNVLVDVLSFEEMHRTIIRNNPVFIMAGGFGKRLRPLTDNCPKPMLKVGDRPILERILDQFIHHGFHRFYLSTHYLASMIHEYFGDGSKWGVSIDYIHEQEPLGTGGALGLLPSDIGQLPLIVMNGDLLTKVDFSKLMTHHEETGVIATMCIREYQHQVPFGVVSIDRGNISNMIEKPVQSFYVNAGVYVIEQSLVRNVEPGRAIDMPTLLQSEINSGRQVGTFPIHEYWMDVGRIDDFERAQFDVSNGNLL